jgi:hypothetical protein
MLSHRILRYGSGVLHVVLLVTSLVAAADGAPYTWVVGAQLLLAAAALAGVGIARYYALVTLATLVSLRNYLRRGVPATWEAAEGTR